MVVCFSLISPLPSSPPQVYQVTTKPSNPILSLKVSIRIEVDSCHPHNLSWFQSDAEKYWQRSSAGVPYGELLGLYLRLEEHGGRENVWVKTKRHRHTFLMMKDGGTTNKNVV